MANGAMLFLWRGGRNKFFNRVIHILGYIALVLNLVSMTRKEVTTLRIFSAIANLIYVFYGLLLNAPPLIIGCSIAVGIHLFHIIRLMKAPQTTHYEK